MRIWAFTPIPASVTYEQALFTGDILSSGFWGAEIANINQGDCVAVIGAGPVGCARPGRPNIWELERLL